MNYWYKTAAVNNIAINFVLMVVE